MAKKQGQDNKKKKIIIGVLCGVLGLGAIAGVTIPLVMCHPNEKIIVYFETDGQEGVEISQSQASVTKGTTFAEARSQVFATKVVNNQQFLFKYWYLKTDSEQQQLSDKTKITKSIHVCPKFENEPLPADAFLIAFIAGPGDEGVKIDPQFKVITRGDTFAKVGEVQASKTTPEGNWSFVWWYKDGDKSTDKILDDTVIGKNTEEKYLVVHPYFLPPKSVYKVEFSNGGDKTIHFNVDKLTYTATDGTELSKILEESKIEATKQDGSKKWEFKYWTLDLKSPEDKPWEKPQMFGEGSKITHNVVLYPYFEEKQETWISKTVEWEQLREGVPVDKTFRLPPQKSGTTQMSTIISNFVLSYTEPSEKIPELQSGESIEFEIKKPEEGVFTGVNISAELLPQSQGTAPNKFNVKFTFDNLPTDETLYKNDLIFGVTFKLFWNGEQKTSSSLIDGLTISFSDPWEAPTVTFQSASQIVDCVTKPGTKDFLIKHYDENQFIINRAITNRETLKIKVLDSSGSIVDNVLAEPIVTNSEDGESATIDVSLSFKQIKGIFEEHISEFTLQFITTYEGTGLDYVSSNISKIFRLIYTPDEASPYGIVMNDTYLIDGDLGAQNINVQIESEKAKKFAVGDFVTIRNITREGLTQQQADETSPIYFTSPQENVDFEIGGSQVALEGQDEGSNVLSFKIHYNIQTNIPSGDDVKTYETQLQIDFWRGNPEQGRWVNGQPENVPEGVEHNNTITRNVKFVFTPKKLENYTSADWAQYRTIAISQSAVNKKTNKVTQKLGTAWYLSNVSDNESYFATSLDIKKDYEELTSSNYRDYKFGYTTMGAAKPYVASDSTKYLVVNSDISAKEHNLTKTDLIEYSHQETDGKPEWMPVRYWDATGTGYYHNLYAPNLAIFKLDPSAHPQPDYNDTYDQAFRERKLFLDLWAQEEGLTPRPNEGEIGGQVSRLFHYVPDDFSRDGFAYGFTGGFKSKTLKINEGTKNERTERVIYWRDYTMYAEFGELGYLKPDYYGNCVGCEDLLYKLPDTDPEHPNESVYHRCGAFVMTWDSFDEDDYFDDAGRGAMLLLRKYAADKVTLEAPYIAGINWNGGSNWNWWGNITPYFDVWQYGGVQQLAARNLIIEYENPWDRKPHP